MMKDGQLSVPGLRNLGNTCYINAVLQALAASDHFQKYVSDIQVYEEDPERPFAYLLFHCLQDLRPKSWSQITAINPRDLNFNLSQDSSMFRGMHQQDAEEGFQLIMEKLDNEVNQSKPDVFSLSALLLGTNGCQTSPSRGDTRNPFYGLTGNMLECSRCMMKKPMWTDTFLDLKLSLCPSMMYNQRPFRHIQDSLRHYTSKEQIDGVECTQCTVARLLDVITEHIHTLKTASPDTEEVSLPSLFFDAPYSIVNREDALIRRGQLHDLLTNRSKSTTGVCDVDFDDPASWTLDEARIWENNGVRFPSDLDRVHATFVRHVVLARPPRVLAFHINRNVYANDKIVKLDDHLTFQETFHLTPPLLQQESLLAYQLVAVVVHHGNERGGHYTCYRRVQRGNWVHISDERVMQVTLHEVLLARAYMIYYECTEPSSSLT